MRAVTRFFLLPTIVPGGVSKGGSKNDGVEQGVAE